MKVDKHLCEELCSCSTLFRINDIPHLEEHSIEVLLPFVKFCFPDACIIPVLTRGSRPSLISGLARALRVVFESIREKTLFVLSTNLAAKNSGEKALEEAEKCAGLIIEKNTAGFEEAFKNGSISPCGGTIAASFLESGLAADAAVKQLSFPLVKALDEQNNCIYYGAFSFE
jgi:AmmeMemoRadiSam system protein B